jgi:hypothetical protein
VLLPTLASVGMDQREAVQDGERLWEGYCTGPT